ncbi:hypothetical protein GC096_26020 [Paenibacillus sp. LMG 31461]|uniref:Lipoprotein n=1 Tax=Paenibacillus plantarum TaxID=2654975 RepID=A0ABX1XI06_9BACL|nr:hypothetical protein [Paenibacillus plantarum]NOU67504.1 hypothetical protein [Paenibacillus plantarum]
MKRIVLMITVMLIFTGCDQSRAVKPFNTPKITDDTPLILPLPEPISTVVPLPGIIYIDDKQYSDPTQNDAVKIINENTMAINSRDKTKFLATFASSSSGDESRLESNYNYITEFQNEYILNMESIKFNQDANGSGPNEYGVTLVRTIYLKSKNETKQETSTYYFKEVNNQLKLFAID